MSRRVLIRFVLWPLVVGGILSLLIFGGSEFLKADRSFPQLAIGSYVGAVTGLASDGTERTLYIERLASSPSLLVVVFEEGWLPQRIALLPFNEKESASSNSQDVEFIPVRLRHQKNTLRFFGEKSPSGYFGEFETSEGSGGHWRIQPMAAPRDLLDPSLPLEDLQRWLHLRAQADILQEDLSSMEDQQHSDNERTEKLTRLLQQEDVLKARAMNRREVLSQEVQAAILQHKALMVTIDELVEELGLVNRINRKGQAIEVARRLARRENKWYLANWSEDRDANLIAEYLSANPGLDLVKLNALVGRAEEINRLQREAETERRRIVELENLPSRPSSAPRQPSPGPANPNEQNGFWNKLFG